MSYVVFVNTGREREVRGPKYTPHLASRSLVPLHPYAGRSRAICIRLETNSVMNIGRHLTTICHDPFGQPQGRKRQGGKRRGEKPRGRSPR